MEGRCPALDLQEDATRARAVRFPPAQRGPSSRDSLPSLRPGRGGLEILSASSRKKGRLRFLDARKSLCFAHTGDACAQTKSGGLVSHLDTHWHVPFIAASKSPLGGRLTAAWT